MPNAVGQLSRVTEVTGNGDVGGAVISEAVIFHQPWQAPR
jgi:hypothetical protein